MENNEKVITISKGLYERLTYLGLVDAESTRDKNVGASDYVTHLIQPWSIWLDYPNLTSRDLDIIKRVLRLKKGEPRKQDYKKIIHICQERIRQIEILEKTL